MSLTISENINSRQLSIWDYLQMDIAEREEYAGVGYSQRMNKTDNTDKTQHGEDMLERILTEANLTQAIKRVKKNKGASGVDEMTTSELTPWLILHQEELRQRILDGKYRPKAVRQVEIPKANGKTRKLGIPTVIDRVIQQAISQVLSPIYEQQFSDTSYGFRPKRSAHMALEKSLEYANEGYLWVVDMDLEKFFDTVNQSKLVQLLSNTIKDGRVISLIHKFLRTGILNNGMFEENSKGVPQGGPLSPLLGNIMLNESDKELEKRGHRFVRYADDIMIFCKSRKAAERTLKNITSFLEGKLFLKVNREKSKVAYISKVKFLGHGFYVDKAKEVQLSVSKSSLKKLKDQLRQITGRSNGMGIVLRRNKLNQIIRGFVNYFKLANMKKKLEQLDCWLRRRLRMVTWKRWKRIGTRFNNLVKAGISKWRAWQWSNTRRGYWAVAGSPILSRAITNEMLVRAGYIFLSDHYAKVK